MHLDRLAERIHQLSQARLREARILLEQLSRPCAGMQRNLDDRRHRLTHLAASLDALSPLAVLARGYSLTFQAGWKNPYPICRSGPAWRSYPD